MNDSFSQVPSAIKSLRAWIITQEHLNICADDQWLLSFYRGCKLDMEETKQKLDTFYTLRTLSPELFSNRDPFSPGIQELLDSGFMFPLPYPINQPGKCIIFCRVGSYNAKIVTFDDVSKLFFMVHDILLNEDDNFVTSGMRLLQDGAKVNEDFTKSLKANLVKKDALCYQECYPAIVKESYFFNHTPFAMEFMETIQSYFSNETKQRCHFYTEDTLPQLYDIIPKTLLPNEYGGEAGPIDKLITDWKKKVESYANWFATESTYRNDETKRSGKQSKIVENFLLPTNEENKGWN